MSQSIEAEIAAVSEKWAQAIVANDADAIGSYMADGWTIVGPDGSVNDKARFLDLVRSGKLTHDTMTSEDLKVRVFGDSAVVTCRSTSAGEYQGQSLRLLERVSDFFVKQQGRWVCVHTHLSRLADGSSEEQ
jgi:ketosteroid isomerase-like protein